ncbi:acetyl-CoA carboxylase carboxyl transferase subunit alpha [Nonomuraea aridisoli]|uniref:Multifunctional fusion protein n=1 Tax=Nonomuraea aridisoli TaxID=2070368 RepID=A0A2W2EYS8_9ACTN|nr:acetyl-CoA carboxylase carboxyl transferase subunit alpha [Nonomuraea aridisoli]PZG18720.1 acetyl-CoA carboxylase carboxyl transferase subunit beta [Nonomuraea aridisoli]
MSDWRMCPGCRHLVYGRKIDRNLGVCPECGHHFPLTATERLIQLLDEDSAELLPAAVVAEDPLGFADSVPYPERLARAREHTGLDEAVVCAVGRLEGLPLAVAVMDFRFLGGSLGAGVGEMITRIAEKALREHLPLLIVTASGGARMQEGPISLMQMAKTSQAIGQVQQAGLLTVSLITDPTYGGVAASFATLADVIVCEPAARLGFAGRRVVEQTIRERLPAEFQTAEFLLERGMIDMIRRRSELRPTLARVLSAGTREPAVPSLPPARVRDVLVEEPRLLPAGDSWEVVRRARDIQRPNTLDYLRLALDDFDELHGDRMTADCPAVVGGLGRLEGLPLMVIGQQKGHDATELAKRNYGMPSPAGYRKAARLLRLADRLGLPVLTLVDTPGAYPGSSAEENGQAGAIAENLRLLAGLSVPVVCVITGEGGSGGALALALADRVFILENAVYSVISPEGCAAILWNDPAAAPAAAASLRLEPRSLLELGVVDGVIREPAGGAGADHVQAAERLRAVVTPALRELQTLAESDLVSRRHERYRSFGAGREVLVP